MQNIPAISAKDSLTLQLAFNGAEAQQIGNIVNLPQNTAMKNQPQFDVIETSKKAKKDKEPKEKVPLRQKFLNFIASMKKIGVNIKEYGKGTFKGIAKSTVGAVATVGALFTTNQVVKAAKDNKEFTKIVGATFQNLSAGLKSNLTKEGIKKTLKSAKGVGAIAAAALVFAGVMIKTLYDSTLSANKRKHDIDERYQKTPAIVKY